MATLSKSGKDLLMRLEGYKLKPYPDAKGFSIGYGHFIQPDESYLMNGITRDQAESLFLKDIKTFEKAVSDNVKVPLTQNQADALIILVYNLGETKFRNTELLKLINEKAPIEAIVKRWKTRYITTDGTPSPVLVDRRKKEAELFASSTGNTPGAGTYLTLAAMIGLLYAVEK